MSPKPFIIEIWNIDQTNRPSSASALVRFLFKIRACTFILRMSAPPIKDERILDMIASSADKTPWDFREHPSYHAFEEHCASITLNLWRKCSGKTALLVAPQLACQQIASEVVKLQYASKLVLPLQNLKLEVNEGIRITWNGISCGYRHLAFNWSF